MDVKMEVDYYEVKKLRLIVLDNLAKNPSSVGSLSRLPDKLARLVFKRCVQVGVLKINGLTEVVNQEKKLEALDFFVKEGRHKLLISMQLSGGVVFIRRQFYQLSMLLTHLKKLDFTSSCLGPFPDLIGRIGQLQNLQVLNLRKNCLCNESIDKLTYSLRKFKTGLVKLEYLNLSDNPALNDEMTHWLSGLKELKYLNLAGTTITIKSCQKLQEQNLVVSEITEFDEVFVATSGWAKIMVDQYSKIIHGFAEERRNRKASFWPHPSPCIENFFCCHNPTDSYNKEQAAKFYSNFIFKKV